jgi:acetyltransferase-like isoleucine patch superfamily enzyme
MSLVTKDLDPWGVYVGIPAKRIRDRKKELLEMEKQLLAETTGRSGDQN